MRIGLLVLYVSSALGARYAVAQGLTEYAVLGAACTDFNQTAMNYIAAGRLKQAESTLSAALADPTSGSDQPCGWLTLHNLATVMGLSGRLVEAEVLEKRSLKILEKGYPPDDPVLLRPLQSLVRFFFPTRESMAASRTRETCSQQPLHAITLGSLVLQCSSRVDRSTLSLKIKLFVDFSPLSQRRASHTYALILRSACGTDGLSRDGNIPDFCALFPISARFRPGVEQ
jgi:hypothetical protein